MWECLEFDTCTHSVPIDDLFQHTLDITCDCNPVHEIVHENLVMYQHSSFDNREHSEADHDNTRCAYCTKHDII